MRKPPRHRSSQKGRPVRPVVFLGPSLSRAEARQILDADFRPQIQRGDLRTLVGKARLVGIIDGAFFQHAAISPSEVRDALEAGLRIYGGASMGALRPAECRPFGMVRVGRIYEWFKDGVLESDDEVAVA